MLADFCVFSSPCHKYMRTRDTDSTSVLSEFSRLVLECSVLERHLCTVCMTLVAFIPTLTLRGWDDDLGSHVKQNMISLISAAICVYACIVHVHRAAG